jgi:hypothetical protein
MKLMSYSFFFLKVKEPAAPVLSTANRLYRMDMEDKHAAATT